MREMNKILHIFISNDYFFFNFRVFNVFPKFYNAVQKLRNMILKEISVQNFNVKMKY